MVPRLLSNGSEIIDGMLLNVVENSVDFIWSSLFFNLERNKYIEYLPSIYQGHPAIFIANQDFETIDWNLYLQPFSFQLWVMIIIVAFVFALVIYGIQWTHLLNKPVCIFYTLKSVSFKKILEKIGSSKNSQKQPL